VQAHGFVDRVSKDVDLFTTMATADEFTTAQAEVPTRRAPEGGPSASEALLAMREDDRL
jgi:hypothetical protein